MKTKRCPWILPTLIILMLAALLAAPGLALADDTVATEEGVLAGAPAGESPLPDGEELAQDEPEPQVPDATLVDGLAEPLDVDSESSPEKVPGADGIPAGAEPAESVPHEETPASTPVALDDAQAEGLLPEELPAADAEGEATDEVAVDEDADAELEAEAEAPEEAKPVMRMMLMAAAPAYKASKAGWNSVNGSYYWYEKAGDTTPRKGWLVTGQKLNGSTGGLQRYWLDATSGALAFGKLVNTGSGVWTYARPEEGYVVRGKFTNPDSGYVYLANNDGKLEATGWLVSNKYGDGLQRYWIDSKAHAAIPGYSSAGWNHYTRPEGYVVRGKYVSPETDYVYLANNDGKLEMGGSGKGGWLVSNKYDGGYQRYWIDSKAHAAIPGYSNAGWLHYTLPSKGYVARGSFTDTYGRTGSANNDGKLLTPRPVWNGWIVTSAFGQGMQRYWFENDKMVKDTLLSAKKAGWWAFARPEGYVVRGKYVHPETGRVYLANNDGKLADPGWIVTNAYDGGYQRYWIDSTAHAAVPGYSKNGWEHYTLEGKGYVARNQYQYIVDGWYYANNDGKLERKSPKVADVIEAYIKWALKIAADDSHGYSQLDRWGPDYDCSSFVVSSLKAAGLKVGYASWTGNMKDELVKYGWTWITDISKRTRGDILLNITSHTEIYLGNGENVGAHYDENGGIGYGAETGDQTKHEICKGSYWNDNWNGILRLERIV